MAHDVSSRVSAWPRTRLRAVSADDAADRPVRARSRSKDRPEERYSDLHDRRLAAILAAEDTAEEHGLSPHTRSTCYVHRCWSHQCVSDPLHALVVTGHRWCRRCDHPVDVVLDEPARSVELRCASCGLEPLSAANRQVLYACRTSLAAMYAGATPTLYAVPDS
jgi:hypothetical protein